MPRFAPQPFYRPKPSLLVRLPIQITPPPYLSNRSLCEWAYRNHHDLNPVLHTQPTDGTQFSDEEEAGEEEAKQQSQPFPQPLPTPFSPHPATPTSSSMSDTTEPEVQPSATPEMPERVEIPSDEEVFDVWEGEAEGGDPRAVFDGSGNDGSDNEGLAQNLNDYKEDGSSLLVSTDPAGKDMEPTNSSDDDDAPIRGTGALHDDSDDDIFIENSSKGPELLSRLRRGNAGTSKQPARVNSPSSDDDEHQPTPPTQPAQPILPVPEPSELPEPVLPEESSASADSCQLNGSLDGPQADAVATPTGADGAEVGVSRKRTAQNAPSASGSERRRRKRYQLASLRDHGFWQDSRCETNPCQGDEQEYQPVLVIYHCGSNAVIGLVARTPQCGRRPLRQSRGCWPLAPVTCYGRRWRTREADDYGT